MEQLVLSYMLVGVENHETDLENCCEFSSNLAPGKWKGLQTSGISISLFLDQDKIKALSTMSYGLMNQLSVSSLEQI